MLRGFIGHDGTVNPWSDREVTPEDVRRSDDRFDLVNDYAVSHGADLPHVARSSLDNFSLCFRCDAAIEIGDIVDDRNTYTYNGAILDGLGNFHC